MNTQEKIDVLNTTRERLMTKGWKTGDFGHSEGPNCLVGAYLYSVDETENWFNKNFPLAQSYLRDLTEAADATLWTHLSSFNDKHEFNDVIDFIDQRVIALKEEL